MFFSSGHLCVVKDASLREPEEEGRAEDLKCKFLLYRQSREIKLTKENNVVLFSVPKGDRKVK